MATNAETQALITEAQCYVCYGISMTELLELAQLRRTLLALDPTADTSGQALIMSANCLNCYGYPSMAELLKLGLQYQISINSVGILGFNDPADGDPPFTPTTDVAIAINEANGHQWQWFAGAWH